MSNESDEPVYFDNMRVSHNRGRIVEEDHYYAFGLKIACISSRKLADVNEGNVDNKYLYNDKELFDDGDLNWEDYGFRNYDVQLGRFVQIDPLTDETPALSGYHYALNDPITNIDEDGLSGVNSIIQQVACAGERVGVAGLSPVLMMASLAVNALKIAANIVSEQIANKTLNEGLSNKIVENRITAAVLAFAEVHQNEMNFGDLVNLNNFTRNYFKGLNLMAWWRKGDFQKLNTNVINNEVLKEGYRVEQAQNAIADYQSGVFSILYQGANVGLFISGAALFPDVGVGPRGAFKFHRNLHYSLNKL